jgi:hypothetical protein
LSLFQNAFDFVAQVASLADTDQIALDVGHEDGNALIGEVLGQSLQTDRFTGACGPCNEAVAVGHAHQNVAICGLIAGNQELIWHEKGSSQLEK